jgi:hypothetical protein
VIHDIHRILKDKAEPSAENQSIFKQLRAVCLLIVTPESGWKGSQKQWYQSPNYFSAIADHHLSRLPIVDVSWLAMRNAACKILAEIVPASRKQSAVSGGGSGGD